MAGDVRPGSVLYNIEGAGPAVVLSGNTMFWRVSYSDDGSVMECRKFDPAIGMVSPNTPAGPSATMTWSSPTVT